MALSDQHLDAWRAVVTSHAAVTDRVQKALASAATCRRSAGSSSLAAVEASPDGPPRMSDLAEYLTLSRGGITKLVDRLSDAGYLERVSCSDDRRSLHAELTPAGERMLEEMRVVYRGELARHLGSISAAEAELIADALGRVTGSTCASERGGETEPADAAVVAEAA